MSSRIDTPMISDSKELSRFDCDRSYESFCRAVRQALETRLPAMYDTAKGFPAEKVSLAISQTFDLERLLRGKRIRIDDLEPMLDRHEKDLFDDLRQLRAALAREAGIPAYRVFTNQAMLALVRRKPLTTADLMAVPGIGEKTSDRFGEAILDAVSRHCFYETGEMPIFVNGGSEGCLIGDYD